ncbi:MAG TPA: hypothetical protein VL134_12865, partial [Leptolyngbya sp.]|nr:hypothetical protein [Leptolyngbya sp.]
MKRTTHQLLAATLVISGSLSGIQSAIAQSTTAGTTISNTATATYSDGTTTYNATSNTVTVKVAEVPGINITVNAPTNAMPNAGDTLTVDFVISNVGNDPTQFFIPGTATLVDGTNFSINGQLQIVAVDGTVLPTPKDVPTNGDTTGNLLGIPPGSIAVAPGGASKVGTVTVRVPIKVSPSAPANANTTVALGETATPNAQNVDRGNNISTKDVYTVDNPDTVAGETPGVLTQVNEAMATSSTITVNARLQAFAAVLKAVSSYNNNGTANVLTDDTLTYGLALRVDNPTPPPTGLAASDLNPTAIKISNAPENQVLISDAIPQGTVLSSATPIVPTGWEVVYTTDATTITANNSNWQRIRPGGTITRVGFIR